MNNYLKVVAVAIVAILLAVVASRLLQSSSDELLNAYETKYQSLAGKQMVSDAERAELDALFKELNSTQRIQSDLLEFAVRHALLFLLFIPITLYGAKSLALDDAPMYLASALIFLAFILADLMVAGAIMGALFFIASASYSRGRRS